MCGGVLVPAYMRAGRVVYWRRTCFVEERGLAEVLADVVWADSHRPLQPSEDHYLPSKDWPDSTRMHIVHLYCQKVQGNQIGSAMVGREVSYGTRAKLSAAAIGNQHALGHDVSDRKS